MQKKPSNILRKITKWRNRLQRVLLIDPQVHLAIFAPNSTAAPRVAAELTLQSVQQTVPNLAALAAYVVSPLPILEPVGFPQSAAAKTSAKRLRELFTAHGSDKSTRHNYEHIYGTVLSKPSAVRSILEIGLGTNNTDVPSNMGTEGKPGASLRAFRDYCPSAQIFGADIDRRVLFREERIETFHVDQTNADSFELLDSQLPEELDLVIDDGLHSPNANVATLLFGMKKIRKGGWVIVEDISLVALPVWQIVAAMMPSKFEPMLFSEISGRSLVFAVRRVG